MNNMEKMIWAAAFVGQYVKEKDLVERRNWESEVDSFTCAEVADEVVEKYREISDHPDKEYLLIYEEENEYSL